MVEKTREEQLKSAIELRRAEVAMWQEEIQAAVDAELKWPMVRLRKPMKLQFARLQIAHLNDTIEKLLEEQRKLQEFADWNRRTSG
jgi:hypothetical protein